MISRFFFVAILLVVPVLIGVGAYSVFEQGHAQENNKPNNSDGLSLAVFLRTVSSFEKEASKQDEIGNQVRANALRNYFQKKARLDEAQMFKLKRIADSYSGEAAEYSRDTDSLKDAARRDNRVNRNVLNANFDLMQRYREKVISETGWKRQHFLAFLQKEIGGRIKTRWN